MAYELKYINFISDTDKKMMKDDLLQEIDHLYNASLKEYHKNNIEENAKYLKTIWEKLPKVKSKLSVSYHIARELVEDFMIIKDYEEAMKWAMETFKCSASRYDYGERELLLGKVAYESGDIDKAKEYFTIADKKSNGRVFEEDDIKYLKIIRSNLKNQDSSKSKKVWSVDNKQVKHFTEEELDKISQIDVSSEVIDIVNEAEDLMSEMKYKEAIKLYEKAFKSLQYPVQDFLNILYIQEGMGEAYFYLGEYEKVVEILSKIYITPYGEETDDPNVLLRLGQSLIEIGELEQGKEVLLKAYAIGGRDIFNEEDPKYYHLIKREDEQV